MLLGVAGAKNLQRNLAERKDASYAFAMRLAGVINGFKASNLTQRAMVVELNLLGVCTARGGEWSLIQLQRTLKRILNKL